MFLITFILVLIFRKINDQNDLEFDPNDDDKTPIYLNHNISLSDIEKTLKVF